MLYLVLTVISLHFLAMPIVFGVFADFDTVKDDGELRIAFFGIPIFVKRLTPHEIMEKSKDKSKDEENEKPKKKKSGKFGAAVKSFIVSVAIETVKRVRIRHLRLSGSVGIGDAATTAFIVGGVRIACAQASAFFGYGGEIGGLKPDYDTERIDLTFGGIFSLSFADIIYAVCTVLVKRITGR